MTFHQPIWTGEIPIELAAVDPALFAEFGQEKPRAQGTYGAAELLEQAKANDKPLHSSTGRHPEPDRGWSEALDAWPRGSRKEAEAIGIILKNGFRDYVRIAHDPQWKDEPEILALVRKNLLSSINGMSQEGTIFRDALERGAPKGMSLDEIKDKFITKGIEIAEENYLAQLAAAQEQPAHITAVENDPQPEVTSRFKEIIRGLGAKTLDIVTGGHYQSGEIDLRESVAAATRLTKKD